MKDISRSLVIARNLFFFNAVLWLGNSFIFFVDVLRIRFGQGNQKIIFLMILFLFLGNVVAMVLNGFLIIRMNKGLYRFVILILIVNSVLTIVYQPSLFSLISLIVNLVLFKMLISMRKQYF